MPRQSENASTALPRVGARVDARPITSARRDGRDRGGMAQSQVTHHGARDHHASRGTDGGPVHADAASRWIEGARAQPRQANV